MFVIGNKTLARNLKKIWLFPSHAGFINTPGEQSVLPRFVDTFFSPFQEKRFLRSQVCRTAPSQSALEYNDPGASNDVSNFGSPHLLMCQNEDVQRTSN